MHEIDIKYSLKWLVAGFGIFLFVFSFLVFAFANHFQFKDVAWAISTQVLSFICGSFGISMILHALD